MLSAELHNKALKHIARRGVEAYLYYDQISSQNGNSQDPFGCDPESSFCLQEWGISNAGIIIIASTIVIFGIIILALRYTLWGVVNTLAMIETPRNGFLLETPPKPLDQNGQTIDVEVSPIQLKPVTNSIRDTIRHLHRTAGFRARWRGLVIFICYSLVFNFISGLVTSFFSSIYLSFILSSVIAALVLSLWSTAWTHIVISEPSAKPWYARIPGAKAFKNVWLAVAINALAERLVYVLPILTASAAITFTATSENRSPVYIVSETFGCFFVGLATYVFITLPSKIALIRVQASMLPEEDEAIVNFDRSFNSKVVPEIVGGTGALSFMDAWRSIDREARLRVVKNVVKLCSIEIALHLALFVTVIGEVLIFAQKKERPQHGSF